MTNKLEAGQIIEGKVTGIQPYGAFVSLNEKVQGLVHISEVTHGFVKDINDHLTIGDAVKVKVMNVDAENKKYSLSIRATVEAPKAPSHKQEEQVEHVNESSSGFNTLKGKLEEWMEQSKEREQSFKK